MKKLSALVLATLMLFTVFASLAMAANNTTATSGNSTVANTVEIRGPVYSGSDIADIIAKQGTDGTITMNADQFAAFFYDINNNVTTETLSIKNVSGTSGNTIGVDGLVYSTSVAQTNYQFNKNNPDATTRAAWGSYNVIGFFADKYIPLNSNDASKLAKLVLDSKDKYTLKTGEKLDLSQGYSLTAKQVDVNGNKVWLELDKDGSYVADQIVTTDSGDHTWTEQLDNIQGESNVTILKVHVNQVFQGAESSIAQIDGLWLIDYANAIKISTTDSFGKLDDVALNGNTITISNKDTFSLTKNSDIEIGNGLFFKVADTDANTLRFYAYKQETATGTYDVRGSVATGAYTWDASNFAGFFYDLKKDVSTESLKVLSVNGRSIPESNLVYSTTIQNIDYQYTKDADNTTLPAWGSYPVIGFMAQEYVPLLPNDASKLAKLVTDNDDKYSLTTGSQLDLGKGYTLQAKQVDVNGNKVWIELDLNGQHVDDAVIDTASGDHTWTSKLTVLGQQDVPVFKVHISQVFQGAETSVAQIDGLWLIDYANAQTISTSDTFGNLDNVAINGATITLDNKNAFSLTQNTDKLDINGQGMYFNVADSTDLRYYPYIEETIGNGTLTTTNETSTPTINTPVPAVNETQNVTPQTNITAPTNVTETPAPVAPVVETPVQTPVTPVANNTTATPSTPGFSFVPALLGLLAVVYFVRKNR